MKRTLIALLFLTAACTSTSGGSTPSQAPVASPSASASATSAPHFGGARPVAPSKAPVEAGDPLNPSAQPVSKVGVGCGIERWHVKTGTDAGVGTVKTTPQDSTVAALAAIPAPTASGSYGLADKRYGPTEKTTYRITATVTAYKTEADSDVHLALSDGAGHTMIAEIPDPGCTGTSPFKAQMATARKAWSSKHPESPGYQTVNQKVVLTGVGFFDKLHGQRGVAPNGIELHPVLSITFQ